MSYQIPKKPCNVTQESYKYFLNEISNTQPKTFNKKNYGKFGIIFNHHFMGQIPHKPIVGMFKTRKQAELHLRIMNKSITSNALVVPWTPENIKNRIIHRTWRKKPLTESEVKKMEVDNHRKYGW